VGGAVIFVGHRLEEMREAADQLLAWIWIVVGYLHGWLKTRWARRASAAAGRG
jgi:hypothetical protein